MFSLELVLVLAIECNVMAFPSKSQFQAFSVVENHGSSLSFFVGDFFFFFFFFGELKRSTVSATLHM